MGKGFIMLYRASGYETFYSTMRGRMLKRPFSNLKLSEKMQRIFYYLALGHKRTLGWDPG